MVELCVLLCESFNEKNEPINGATIVVAVANHLADIVDNIEDVTKMAQKASNDLKKPLFCGITLIIEGEEFGVSGPKEGTSLQLTSENILDCITFITVKLFDEMTALTTDPVDNLLKELGITRMKDLDDDCSSN